MARRYEFVEGASSKFWEIELDGESFTATWGRIGTEGQSKTQDFDSPAEAKKAHDKLCAEKEKKGYVLKGGAGPAALPMTSKAVQKNPDLEAAIAKDPDNDVPPTKSRSAATRRTTTCRRRSRSPPTRSPGFR